MRGVVLRIEVLAAMPKSDEGHYELVLGNRQLLSGFFVLVILFAIFLTLGYILGRNSAVTSEPGVIAGAAGRSTPSSAANEPEQPAAAVGRPAASETVTEPPAPVAETHPAASSAAPSVEAAPAEKRDARPAVPPAAVVSSATTERTREILGGKVQLITPRKGDMFLQVAAIGRAEAELMAEQLRKRGFRAFLSEVPEKSLFRVLIGPFETSARLNETKKKLSDDGLPSIVQRY
ncbi:MAG: SPOR domain-containing protein [Bryobacterales bacterium]|nr:SPOR domain-containing protein [Bryobacterales bacterium]